MEKGLRLLQALLC